MPYCRQCGTFLDESNRFCPNCGTAAAVPAVAQSSPNPTPPVYAPPVSAPPVYTPPVHTAPTPADSKPKYKRALNIASLIVLSLCLLVWLFVPYISTSYTTRDQVYDYYYDSYWDTWDYDYEYVSSYHYYEGSCGQIVLDLFDGYAIPDLLEDEGPFVLTPIFTFVFISLGLLFTFLKKMAAVRAMGIASTATLGSLAFIQLILSGDLLGAHAGFWIILGGSIALIACSGQRYSKVSDI